MTVTHKKNKDDDWARDKCINNQFVTKWDEAKGDYVTTVSDNV